MGYFEIAVRDAPKTEGDLCLGKRKPPIQAKPAVEEAVAVAPATDFPPVLVTAKGLRSRQASLTNLSLLLAQRIRRAAICFAGDNRPRASGAAFSLPKPHNFQPQRRSP